MKCKAEEKNRLRQMCEYEKPFWDNGQLVAGMDEAGRGPLAGPCVAAAVIMPPWHLIPGVNDSKKLSEKKRQSLYEMITASAAAYAVGIADNMLVDQINILNAAKRAFAEAYRGLDIKPAYVFSDKIGGIDIDSDYQEIVGGDRLCYSVAASSIIAKVTRDEMMKEYAREYPEYGFDRHKGYGTQHHRECIIRYGVCDIHRMSFLKKIIS